MYAIVVFKLKCIAIFATPQLAKVVEALEITAPLVTTLSKFSDYLYVLY
jgi:hypothetical protein